jgi:hypothetical protein
MTANQSNALVKNPNTKKALQILERYARAEATLKALEKEQKEANALILEAMDIQGIQRIEIDMPGLTGYITLAERTSYKADDIMEVEAKYLKSVLDTDKVKAEAVLTGKLPEGISESKTQYITKKLKAV